MLKEVDQRIIFRPTKKIVIEFPNFPVTHEFDALKKELEQLKK